MALRTFAARVRDHVRAHTPAPTTAADHAAWELGWGVVAVRTADGASTVYFDLRRWRVRNPLHDRNGVCPPECRGTIIRVLPTPEHIVRAAHMDIVYHYARRHLKVTRSDGGWRAHPRALPTNTP